jgi:hypothetical protein
MRRDRLSRSQISTPSGSLAGGSGRRDLGTARGERAPESDSK